MLIKDPRAVEPLIETLKDNDFVVRYAAKYALTKITNTDLGEDVTKWREWWEKKTK